MDYRLLNELHMEMIHHDCFDPPNIQHFCKVYTYCLLIGEREDMDDDELFILATAGLTHDIGLKYCMENFGKSDGKLQEQYGPIEVYRMLTKLNFKKPVIDRVMFLIAHHHTYDNIEDLDYQILVEADFLVNLHEGCVPINSAREVYNNIFKTDTGKEIFRNMFLPDEVEKPIKYF